VASRGVACSALQVPALANLGDDLPDVFFVTKCVAESRHPPVQAGAIDRSQHYWQRHLDTRSPIAHGSPLVYQSAHLCLDLICTAFFSGHRDILADWLGRREGRLADSGIVD